MQIEFEILLINNDKITIDDLAEILCYLVGEQMEMQYNEIDN